MLVVGGTKLALAKTSDVDFNGPLAAKHINILNIYVVLKQPDMQLTL